MKTLLLLIALTLVACKEQASVKFQCVQYEESVKPFCEDASKLSEDLEIREIQLRICADPEKRKLNKCVKMERI